MAPKKFLAKLVISDDSVLAHPPQNLQTSTHESRDVKGRTDENRKLTGTDRQADRKDHVLSQADALTEKTIQNFGEEIEDQADRIGNSQSIFLI